MDLNVIQIRRRSISRMEFHRISGIQGSKALTERDSRLKLVLRLKAREGTCHRVWGCV